MKTFKTIFFSFVFATLYLGTAQADVITQVPHPHPAYDGGQGRIQFLEVFKDGHLVAKDQYAYLPDGYAYLAARYHYDGTSANAITGLTFFQIDSTSHKVTSRNEFYFFLKENRGYRIRRNFNAKGNIVSSAPQVFTITGRSGDDVQFIDIQQTAVEHRSNGRIDSIEYFDPSNNLLGTVRYFYRYFYYDGALANVNYHDASGEIFHTDRYYSNSDGRYTISWSQSLTFLNEFKTVTGPEGNLLRYTQNSTPGMPRLGNDNPVQGNFLATVVLGNEEIQSNSYRNNRLDHTDFLDTQTLRPVKSKHYNIAGQVDYIEYFEGSSEVAARTEQYSYSDGKIESIFEYRGPMANVTPPNINVYMLSTKRYGLGLGGAPVLTIETYHNGNHESPAVITSYRRVRGEDKIGQIFVVDEVTHRATSTKYYRYNGTNGDLEVEGNILYDSNGKITRKVETEFAPWLGAGLDGRTRIYRIKHYGLVSYGNEEPFSHVVRVEEPMYSEETGAGVSLRGYDFVVRERRPEGRFGMDPDDSLAGTSESSLTFYSHATGSSGVYYYPAFKEKYNGGRLYATEVYNYYGAGVLSGKLFRAVDHRGGQSGPVNSITVYAYDVSGKNQFVRQKTTYDGSVRDPKEQFTYQRLANGQVVERTHTIWSADYNNNYRKTSTYDPKTGRLVQTREDYFKGIKTHKKWEDAEAIRRTVITDYEKTEPNNAVLKQTVEKRSLLDSSALPAGVSSSPQMAKQDRKEVLNA